MAFSAEREYDDDGPSEEDAIDLDALLEDQRKGKRTEQALLLEESDGKAESDAGIDLFGAYLRRIGKEAILTRAQEFRAALMAETCRNWDTIVKAWGQRRWEGVYRQCDQAWACVQENCRERHWSLPVLQRVLVEASALPLSFREPAPLYIQEYLMALGWGSGRRQEEEQEGCAHVVSVAHDLCVMTEGVALLPKSSQKLLSVAAESEQGLPHVQGFLQHMETVVHTEELQYHERWITDRGIAARKLLGIANARFAVNRAKAFRKDGDDFDDLVGEANCALVEAVRAFQPHRGKRLCTFAGTYIWTALRNQKRDRQQDAMLHAQSIHESTGHAVSLASKMVDPVEVAYQHMLHELLQEVLQAIPERERQILVLRCGLEGEPPHTLDEAGEIFALTRERIRQLEVEGGVKIIRQIARQFPDLLPTGMAPELALIIAEERFLQLPGRRGGYCQTI